MSQTTTSLTQLQTAISNIMLKMQFQNAQTRVGLDNVNIVKMHENAENGK